MKSEENLFLFSRCQNTWATLGVKFSAEGRGVYDEVWICCGSMDALNQYLLDLKSGESTGEDLEM